MKKLMFLAVAAAATAASAAVCVKDQCGDEFAGTAYKVAISLKTTGIQSKTIRVSQFDDPECAYWRQQKTIKVNGLIWAWLDDCSCDWISDSYNYAFWTKDAAIDAEFAIGVGMIGKPDKNGYTKKAEGYGAFNGDDFGELAWAGFGTIARTNKKVQCEDDECAVYLKSLSGGIAGKLVPAAFEGVCGDACEEVEYTSCCDEAVLEYTAAYGTIKINYDATTAKKVALAGEDASIASFFKVPAAVAGDLDDLAGTITVEE